MSSDLLSQAEQAHQQGDLQHAEALYRRVLAAGDGTASACYGLGTLMMQRGELQQAQDLLAEAARKEPEAADIAFNHALCLERMGQTETALTEANRASVLSRGDAHFAPPIAELLLRLGDAAAAVTLLTAAPLRDRSAALLLARAFGQTRAWDSAVSLLRQLQAQLPDDVEVAEQLSVAAARLRDYPLAISAFERRIALSNVTARERIRFADLLLMAREVEAASEQLELAAAAGGDDADYHLLRARIARLRGDDDVVMTASRDALERAPDMGQAWSLCVESADADSLSTLSATLAERRRASSANQYDQQLMAYAAATAADRLDERAAAAEAWRAANRLQAERLGASGLQYRPNDEEERFHRTQARFTTSPLNNAEERSGRVIFIVGMPRSGTTLVERVLGRLQGVVAGGESDALGFVVSQYERDLAAGQLPEPAALSSEQWHAMAHRYRTLNAVRGEVITDKMPHNYLHVGMVLGMFPDARVIQMRRDPRDTALSIYSRPFPDDHAYACDPVALAHAWQLSQRYLDHWATIASDRVMDVALETFVDDPEAGGRRIAEFCGLDWDSSSLETSSTDGPSFTFSERQVRQSISGSQVGRWQRYADALPEVFTAFS